MTSDPPAEFAELLEQRNEAARSVWRQLGDVHQAQLRTWRRGFLVGWICGGVAATVISVLAMHFGR